MLKIEDVAVQQAYLRGWTSQGKHQGIRASVIQEFEISITAVGGDQYLVRTENVAKGVQLAEEKVRWPVAQWLEKTKSFMHDPLLGLLQRQPRSTRAGQSNLRSLPENPAASTLIQLGQTLHDELFKGQLHDSWVTAQGVAHNRQELLRLRIGMKDSRLQQLPWEALHARTRPLATGTDVIFSRYILDQRHGHLVQMPRQSAPEHVLRILMVIAAPEDQERLELKQEVHHLQSELHPVGAADDDALLDVQLKILEQPGRAELTQELDRGNYQVLHYAGHSNLGDAGGDLYLVSRQTGLTERLSGEDLAGLLVNNGIKLAVFNSCRGGYSSSSKQGWQERNLAQALVNRGVPSVIAMAERIPDHVAITFTQLLYRNLRKGQSIDLSLNRTRQGLISAYGSHQFYWALPTLYMQPAFDGYLLQTVGDREALNLPDPRNDPFGDMFSEPGLADIDWPVSPLVRSTPEASNTPDISDSANGVSETYLAQGATDGSEDSKASLVNNNDAEAATAMVQRLSSPLSPSEIDGELRVPEEIETPSGFYGKPSTAASLQNGDRKTGADATSPGTASDAAPDTDLDTGARSVSDQASPAQGVAPQENEEPELIGERLTRSHTLHTKLLTAPSMASIALVALLGIGTVAFFGRSRQPRPLQPATALSELSLPAQVEVALNQDRLDIATALTRQLIDGGEYRAALDALDAASPRQQQDVIVLFLRGRAQWSLAKQGSTDFSASDALRSWVAALENEPDWMEISMALGFAEYARGREDLALEAWEQAIALAERQGDELNVYFADGDKDRYVLNAYAGVAMSSLALSEDELDPLESRRLLEQAGTAYLKVLDEAPADFNANSLGGNWLWLTPAIADWTAAKEDLSQTFK